MQADHCVALDHRSDSFGLGMMACVAQATSNVLKDLDISVG